MLPDFSRISVSRAACIYYVDYYVDYCLVFDIGIWINYVNIYRAGVRPILFSGLKVDPEWLHQQTIQTLSWLDRQVEKPHFSLVKAQLQRSYCLADTRLEQTLWGLQFKNPLGLAAGFDKDGVAAGIWSSFGFGFAELGTVTLHAQPGNSRPRLFRLPADYAALNRMGFNNQGAAALAARLKARRELGEGLEELLEEQSEELGRSTSTSYTLHPIPFPIGINLGKSKVTSLEAAAADYVGSFQLLKDLGDYFVVNVSSPNTPGLRSLQATEQLAPILAALQQENDQRKPILVKIAPDLDWEAIASVIDLIQTYRLAGVIATNTTINREGLKTQIIASTGKLVKDEPGGISGAPVRQRSTEVIRFIWQQTQGELPIIGVGGIFTAEDAWEKLTAGASLIQTYTGWIYEGPGMVRNVLAGLQKKLDLHKLASLSEAIGLEHQ